MEGAQKANGDSEHQGDGLARDGSVDWYSRPAKKAGTGGWRSGIFLLVSHGLAALSFVGVEVNLVLFSTRVLKQTNSEAATTFSRWMGVVHLFSLIGGFLSDSYWGSYKTCVVFQSILVLGLSLLSSSTDFFLLKPWGCGKVELPCQSHSSAELAVFYVSLYLVALGSGGYEPALATMGSNQFEELDEREKPAGAKFYSLFYVATNLGSLFSETILAYLEDSGKWVLSFWLSAGGSFLALGVFLSGTLRYRYLKPCGNPASRFCQVIVAATKKTKIQTPTNGGQLYEIPKGHGNDNGTRNIIHSNDFKFLDKAALITSEDQAFLEASPAQARDPWRLCTVTEVEEVKCVLRLLPPWLCTIVHSTVFMLILSLFLEQGAAMNNAVGSFRMPPASMTVFDIVSTSFFIICYETLFAPLYSRITNSKPREVSELQRIKLGFAGTAVALVVAAAIELQRLKFRTDDPAPLSSLCIFWQVPQYVIFGVAEALFQVGQMNFFGNQIPDALKSLGIALSMASISIGSFLSTLLISVTMKITTRGGRPGWVPPNLNDGHLDRFFLLLAGITLCNLGAFFWCTARYKSIVQEERSHGAS